MIKIIIADDMKDFCDHFRVVLNNEDDFEVIAIADSEEKVINLARKLNPDIVLMDIQMDSDEAGLIATREISKTNPEIKIIMLTIHSDRSDIIKAFEWGAYDFIDKTVSDEELINSIRNSVSKENISNSKKVNRVIVEEFVKMKKERESVFYIINLLSRLSATEVEILKSVIKGKRYKDIADERLIEETTVRTLVSRICDKTGIRPLKELVRIMEQHGIVNLFNDINEE